VFATFDGSGITGAAVVRLSCSNVLVSSIVHYIVLAVFGLNATFISSLILYCCHVMLISHCTKVLQ